MPLDPGDNLKAAEDFLLTVLHSHMVAAAKVVLSNKEHPVDLELVSRSIVQKFVNIKLPHLPHHQLIKSTSMLRKC